jgi:hypothetical protein
MRKSTQIRAARRAKTRNRQYRPKPVRSPMLVASQLVLGPVEAIIERLDIDGTVHTDRRGTPIFQDGDGKWYDAAEAIEGVVWHFETMQRRHGLALPLDGLRELVIAFRYVTPVQPSTMRKLRAAMPMLRRAMALADDDDQLDILQTTRIRAEMEAAASLQDAENELEARA